MIINVPSKNITLKPYRGKYDLSELWRLLDLPKCKRPYYWNTKVANTLRNKHLLKVRPIYKYLKGYKLPKRNRTTYGSVEAVYEYLAWIDHTLYIEAIRYSRGVK